MSWTEVVERRTETDRVREDRLVLDSVEPIDRNMETAIASLR